MNDYFKHLLIRTPLEKPAKTVKSLLNVRQRLQHPELQEIYLESMRIEQCLERVISHSSNCIDIGCHLGSTLSEILRLSPQGKHIAFEPIPYKVRWLKEKFPEVDVQQIALSEAAGQTTFYINPERSGFSGLRVHNASNDEKLEKIVVQCEQLDQVLLPEYRVDFIKLDVEGGELAVLRGAIETFTRYRPILLFECARSGLESFGFTSEQIFDFLVHQHSYSIFLLKDYLSKGKPLSFEQFHMALQYPFQAFNFIALG